MGDGRWATGDWRWAMGDVVVVVVIVLCVVLNMIVLRIPGSRFRTTSSQHRGEHRQGPLTNSRSVQTPMYN